MKIKDETNCIEDELNVVLPPWIAFPNIDPTDIFWRMGKGEDYLDKFFRFYEKLSDKENFQMKFPAENEWQGFYE